jgi:hypothetical protein
VDKARSEVAGGIGLTKFGTACRRLLAQFGLTVVPPSRRRTYLIRLTIVPRADAAIWHLLFHRVENPSSL